MGMLVNGIWYQEEPPHEALQADERRRELCAAGIGVSRAA